MNFTFFQFLENISLRDKNISSIIFRGDYNRSKNILNVRIIEDFLFEKFSSKLKTSKTTDRLSL